MTVEQAEAQYGRFFCRRCADRNVGTWGSPRYSMGIYAGTYCDDCWAEDGRNHDRSFDPLDAGEHYEAEDY